MFQSLFYWKYHFNVYETVAKEIIQVCFNPCFTGSSTSTLLVPLQCRVYVGFNPCFTGSTTSTRTKARRIIELLGGYQTLFYWKYHFNMLKNGTEAELIMFQSLFYWKYHFNHSMNLLQHPNFSSFNPCFTGSTTSTIWNNIRKVFRVRFQSLFYWKYHFNLPKLMRPKEKPTCFNPCFTGSTTSTLDDM